MRATQTDLREIMNLSESGDDVIEANYVIAIDVGTTSVRCHIYNRDCDRISAASEAVQLNEPRKGHVEIHPDELWRATLTVVKNAIKGVYI